MLGEPGVAERGVDLHETGFERVRTFDMLPLDLGHAFWRLSEKTWARK